MPEIVPADTPLTSVSGIREQATDPASDLQLIANTNSLPVSTSERYEFIEEIAHGGMGIIYRAIDVVLDRDVAVKVLADRFACDSPAARRFVDEARITGQLQHPAIPAVHDLGAVPGGRPFLAMKLIKGDTLAELLANRPNPVHKRGHFIAIFEQVCHAIGYAHEHKVIHRDLKPANIMVGGFGDVQVMDWGLAKVLSRSGENPARVTPAQSETIGTEIRTKRDSDGSFTQAGSVLGTPAFMPPEQAGGEIDKVDERADVFGLGAILAVILTGEPPYVGPDTDSVRLMAVRGQIADCLTRLDRCGAEPALVDLCKRCLAFAPNDRPNNAEVVAKEVAALREVAEQRARAAEVEQAKAQTEAREQRKRRNIQLAFAAAVVLLVVGALAYFWDSRRKQTEFDLKQQAEQARYEGEQRALQAGFEADRKAQIDNARQRIVELLDLATAARIDYRFTAAEQALKSAGELANNFLPELAGPVAQARSNLVLVRQLDAIRMKRSLIFPVGGGKYRTDEADAPIAYRTAFASHGFDVVTDGDKVAEQLARSEIRSDLITALDDWAILETEVKIRDAVLAALRRADPDSGAATFREPSLWGDTKKLNQLAAKADVAHMSPGAVVAVAEILRQGRSDAAAPMLRQALSLHPRDFLLAFSLGWVLDRSDAEQIGAYRAARALRPDNTAVLYDLAIALTDAGDLPGAIATARDAIQVDPGFSRGHNALGVALSLSRDFKAAIAEFNEAIRLDPLDADAHDNLGLALRDSSDLPGAIAKHKDAIRLNPKHANAHYNLGVALRDSDNIAGALVEFREAIKLNPRYAKAHNNIGNILRDAGDLRGALAEYCEAARLDPKSASARNNYGNALAAIGDAPGAIAELKEAIRLKPDDGEIHMNLGIALAGANNLPEAIAEYKEAIRLDPKRADAHTALGIALAGSGDAPGAIAAFKEAIRLDPKFIQAHTNLGIVLRQTGDLPGAIAAQKEAIRLDPKFVLAHYNLGNALDDSGDPKAAIAEYREAIKVDPTFVSAHRRLGSALRELNDLPAAIEAFKEAIRLDPKYPDTHYNLGAVYLDQKRFSEAAECGRRAIKLNPRYSSAHALLGLALARSGDVVGGRAALTEAARLEPKRWEPVLAKLPPIQLGPPPRELRQ